MTKRIVVVGSSNVDLIMKMDHLPARDESVPNAKFMQTFGGKGANQAVAAARAGGEVYFVNCVGDDPYAQEMVAGYSESGVNIDYLFREEGVPSGTALIMIGEQGHYYLSVAPGANNRLTPQRIEAVRELLDGAAFILMQYEILPETVERVLQIAHELSVKVIWNVAPAKEFDRSILGLVDILVANEPEASMVTGVRVDSKDGAKRAAEEMRGLGVDTAIITLGEQGSMISTRDGAGFHVDAFPVEAVDTTAAGDTYCGCLATALAEGKNLKEAVRFAAAAAALSVQVMGAQPSTPWRKDIDAFLAGHG